MTSGLNFFELPVKVSRQVSTDNLRHGITKRTPHWRSATAIICMYVRRVGGAGAKQLAQP